jgi:hypothetical protein
VTLTYGEATLLQTLDAAGKAAVNVDLFLGPSEKVSLETADGMRETIEPVLDGGAYSKVALIWQKPVDLDLHAIEGAPPAGGTGNVWSGATPDLAATKAKVDSTGRAAGFLSTADTGAGPGTKIEVYTYIHHPEQTSGAVRFVIDHVTRGGRPSGETCGAGGLAEVPYDVVMLSVTGEVQRDSGVIPAAKCGETLAGATRYLKNAVPDLRYRR